MPKFDSSKVKVDGKAAEVFEDVQKRIEANLVKISVLAQELRDRATNGGDLLEMDTLVTEELASLESRLRGEVAVASSNGKGVGVPQKGAVDSTNPQADVTYQRLLQALGSPARIEDLVERTEREARQGPAFEEFVLNFLDALEDDRDRLVMVSHRPVPNSIVENGRYNERVLTALKAVYKVVTGKDTLPADPKDAAHTMVTEISKLKATPIAPAATEADEFYKLVTRMEAHDPTTESVQDYLTRVVTNLRGQGVTAFLNAIGKTEGVDRLDKESNEDYLGRLIKKGKVGGGNIGDFLDKIGKASTMTRKSGESDEDYATRIFGMAARDHKTFVDMYTWLKKLGVDTVLMDGTDAFTLFTLYVQIRNTAITKHNKGLGVKGVGSLKNLTPLSEHPVPTAS